MVADDPILIFAEYLRQHPTAVEADPGLVARDAGVPRELVMRAFGDSPRRKIRWVSKPAPVWWQTTLDWFDRLTASPITFNAWTGAFFAMFAMLILPTVASDIDRTAAALIGLLIAWPVQLMCMYRHGKIRVAIVSGVIYYCAYLVSAVVRVFASNPPMQPSEAGRMLTVLLISGIFISTIYLALGMAVSVLGAFAIQQRAASSLDHMSRQELIERLIEVQDRLAKSASFPQTERKIYRFPLFRDVRDNPFGWAIVLGVGLQGMQSAIEHMLSANFSSQASMRDPENIIFALMMLALSLAAIGLVSYSTRPFWKSIAATAVCVGSSVAVDMATHHVPVGSEWSALVSGFGLSMLVGFIGAVGGQIEERAAYEGRVLANDSEALLSEFVELQRRLSPGTREVTIMVIDAERSSLMKANSDPLLAEWSFRAYQQFLEKITVANGGEVFSTAGDGATMAFNGAEDALRAATIIQREIDSFNSDVNKLALPFRLRIGIHTGSIMGQIEKVQFAEVIDVAAHVEAACPAGGVTLSQASKDRLESVEVDAMNFQVDGQYLYTVNSAVVL